MTSPALGGPRLGVPRPLALALASSQLEITGGPRSRAISSIRPLLACLCDHACCSGAQLVVPIRLGRSSSLST
jgi:hypothetical protein